MLSLRSVLPVFLLGTMLLTACGEQKRDVDSPQAGVPSTVLRLGMADPLVEFSTLSFQTNDRKYLWQIYEPLVRFDEALNVTSSLALSWGRLDDVTWSFRLRPEVFFHDGSRLTAEDVRAALDAARLNPLSEFRSLLTSIDSIEVVEVDRLNIRTTQADPLLLNRLTQIPVSPKGKPLDLPIGTGPYRFDRYEEGTLDLQRFDAYWGPLPAFEQVTLMYLPSPEDRIQALQGNEVDVLVGVPPLQFESLRGQGFEVYNTPALELSSLFLNPIGAFADPSLREAVALTLQPDYATAFAPGFLLPTGQLSTAGIFAYEPEFPLRSPDLTRALELRQSVDGPVRLQIDLPFGLEALGEALVRDLAAIAVDATFQTYEPVDLEKRILSGESQAYFLGWKYDLADSADFLEAALHSKEGAYGVFNGLAWSDPVLDERLERAAKTLDVELRRTLLQEAMERARLGRVVFPLFEAQSWVALRAGLTWTPRLDGLVLTSEIRSVMVQ